MKNTVDVMIAEKRADGHMGGIIAAFAVTVSVILPSFAANTGTTYATVTYGSGLGRDVLVGDRYCAGDVTKPVSLTAGNGVVTTDKPLTLNGTGGTSAGMWYNNNKTAASYFCYPDRAFDNKTEYTSGLDRALARWSNCGGQLSIVYTFTNGTAYAIGGYRIIVDQGARAPKTWNLKSAAPATMRAA